MNKILQGDCIEQLRTLPDGIVQTCITSPPYYGLRDYGVDGQIGLEETPKLFVQRLVDVFREVKRVLKDNGTLWLNLGDSYAGNSSRVSTGRAGYGDEREGVFMKSGEGLKQKDLMGIPWMVAFALRADGWYLRQDIIWHKPNPMPESVTDRCTKSHEYIFLMSKRNRYFFNHEAIREPNNDTYMGKRGQTKQRHKTQSAMTDRAFSTEYGDGRNKRTVWSIPVKAYSEAHFAVFPDDLIKPCVLAGSAKGDIVLDPFFGSGTTGEVALRAGRQFIGCELNPDYIKIANNRLQPYLSQTNLF